MSIELSPTKRPSNSYKVLKKNLTCRDMTLSHPYSMLRSMKNRNQKKKSVDRGKLYYPLSTIQLLLKPGALADLIKEVAHTQKVEVWCVRRATDLVAVGSLVAVVDPTLVNKRDWSELCGWLAEMDDPHTKVLLTASSPHAGKLPAKNLVRTPRNIDQTFLKLLLVHLRSTYERRKQNAQRAGRQMLRLMYVLARLDRNEAVKVREVAKEFGVSHRTIQRDIMLLLMAGYPIVDTAEPGQYRFVEKFKSYQLYFE